MTTENNEPQAKPDVLKGAFLTGLGLVIMFGLALPLLLLFFFVLAVIF